MPPKIIFISSVQYTGNLGGLAGADATCHSLATAAGLAGTYMAWLSTDTVTASSRLSHSTVPYVLSDGKTVVANNWAGLTSGTLLHTISLTEKQTAPPTSTTCAANAPIAYTDTAPSGMEAQAGFNCNNWTGTAAGSGVIWGRADQTGALWTDFCEGWGTDFCGTGWTASIYCIQQ
jgi:hypothetical protein